MFRYILLFLFLASCKQKSNPQTQDFSRIGFEKKQIYLEQIGKVYFEKNCIPCHPRKGSTDNFLEGFVKNKSNDYSLFKTYTTNEDSLLISKNEFALKINDEFNKINFSHNFKLSNNEVKSIYYYLKK